MLLPIAHAFQPDLVLVSAGFDAALGDPLGGCRITPHGYSQLTHLLCGLAGGRVALVLEGGYNVPAIARSLAACTRVLLGDPPQPLPLQATARLLPERAADITRARAAAAQHWPILLP